MVRALFMNSGLERTGDFPHFNTQRGGGCEFKS